MGNQIASAVVCLFLPVLQLEMLAIQQCCTGEEKEERRRLLWGGKERADSRVPGAIARSVHVFTICPQA